MYDTQLAIKVNLGGYVLEVLEHEVLEHEDT